MRVLLNFSQAGCTSGVQNKNSPRARIIERSFPAFNEIITYIAVENRVQFLQGYFLLMKASVAATIGPPEYFISSYSPKAASRLCCPSFRLMSKLLL